MRTLTEEELNSVAGGNEQPAPATPPNDNGSGPSWPPDAPSFLEPKPEPVDPTGEYEEYVDPDGSPEDEATEDTDPSSPPTMP